MVGELSAFDGDRFPVSPVLRSSMERIDAKYSEITGIIVGLQSRKSILQFQVSDQERRTVELRATSGRYSGSHSTRAELAVAEQRLTELRAELDEVRRQLVDAEAEKANLQKQVDELREIDAYALNNFNWAQHEKQRADKLDAEARVLRARLAELEEELAGLRSTGRLDADAENGGRES